MFVGTMDEGFEGAMHDHDSDRPMTANVISVALRMDGDEFQSVMMKRIQLVKNKIHRNPPKLEFITKSTVTSWNDCIIKQSNL